jgi:hypothetical protein
MRDVKLTAQIVCAVYVVTTLTCAKALYIGAREVEVGHRAHKAVTHG